MLRVLTSAILPGSLIRLIRNPCRRTKQTGRQHVLQKQKIQHRGFAISNLSMNLKLTSDPPKFVVSFTENQPLEVAHRRLANHKDLQQLRADIYLQYMLKFLQLGSECACQGNE